MQEGYIAGVCTCGVRAGAPWHRGAAGPKYGSSFAPQKQQATRRRAFAAATAEHGKPHKKRYGGSTERQARQHTQVSHLRRATQATLLGRGLHFAIPSSSNGATGVYGVLG